MSQNSKPARTGDIVMFARTSTETLRRPVRARVKANRFGILHGFSKHPISVLDVTTDGQAGHSAIVRAIDATVVARQVSVDADGSCPLCSDAAHMYQLEGSDYCFDACADHAPSVAGDAESDAKFDFYATACGVTCSAEVRS